MLEQENTRPLLQYNVQIKLRVYRFMSCSVKSTSARSSAKSANSQASRFSSSSLFWSTQCLRWPLLFRTETAAPFSSADSDPTTWRHSFQLPIGADGYVSGLVSTRQSNWCFADYLRNLCQSQNLCIAKREIGQWWFDWSHVTWQSGIN
jgi:hypothetical protein